jgi:DNA-binding NarL/FixJ family response regulator
MLAFGASACLDTGTQGRDVLSAIHLAARGMRLTPDAPGAEQHVPGGSLRPLTAKETEVLPLLREGRSNAQIALALQVGIETVRTHTRNIYRKLGVSSRHELLAQSRPAPAAVQPAAPRRLGRTPNARGRGHGLRSR